MTVRASLLEAIRLCMPNDKIVPSEALRSPELATLAGGAALVDFAPPQAGTWFDIFGRRAARARQAWERDCNHAWTAFAEVRASLLLGRLADKPQAEAEFTALLWAPRILRTRLGHCTMDGAVPMHTAGFFSEHAVHEYEELPPWDTWIGLRLEDQGACIDSWIPPWALEHAQTAIDIDHLGMYTWVERSDPYYPAR